MMPATTSITIVQVAAEKNSRSASELARIGQREQIAQAAYRLDHVDAELLADAADEDLDGVGVTIEVLIVEVLNELRARHHAAGMMHQIGQQAVFVRGELDRVAVDRHTPGAGVEPNRAAVELALGVTGRPAQQGAHARKHLLEMEWLGDIVVGAGVETLHLSLQRSRAVRINTGMV